MTRLSKYQRFALLAASTTVITGGVLSQGAAFAAPAAPHPVSATAAGQADAAQWKNITDAPSGITVQLPGKPQMQQNTDNQISSRDYVVETGYGAIGFSVNDGPASEANQPWDLQAGLKNEVDGLNSGDPSARIHATDVREATKDGIHYLEANLVGAGGEVGHIDLIDLGQREIITETLGNSAQKDAMDRDYQQVVDSIKLPDHNAQQQAQEPAVAT